MKSKAKIQDILQKYIPENAIDYVISLLNEYPVQFRIVKPRKSKLGDFRYARDLPKPQITINGNLNPYSFLITTIHEFAHAATFFELGANHQPHGIHWQNHYRKLIHPTLELGVYPKDVEIALVNSLINVKASSCSDVSLNRVLSRYDVHNENEVMLENLQKNTMFVLSNRTFTKGELRRTRYLCTEIITNRQFLVHRTAIVKLLK